MVQENKAAIIEGFKKHESDTGSVELQIALLTSRIKNLTEHFRKHAKDFGSKRGLLILVGRRRRFLRYIQERDEAKYKDIIARLGLRR